jgi:hypothetical protein
VPRRLVVTLVATAVILAVFLGVMALVWNAAGTPITAHGFIAYGLGAVFTVGVSLGLFLLLFHSARSGHDDIDPGN